MSETFEYGDGDHDLNAVWPLGSVLFTSELYTARAKMTNTRLRRFETDIDMAPKRALDTTHATNRTARATARANLLIRARERRHERGQATA